MTTDLKRLAGAAVVVFGAIAASWGFVAYVWKSPTPSRAISGDERLDQIQAAAFQALRSSLKANGQFSYLTDRQGERSNDLYNTVRHNGAVWALASYGVVHQIRDVAPDLSKANNFSLKESIRSVGGNKIAALSDPKIEKNDRPLRAALGGSALALLAFLESEKIAPGLVQPETLRGLGHFLVSMQKANGEYFANLSPETNLKSSDGASLYFPGEASLALLRLSEWDSSPEKKIWRAAAVKGLDFLVSSQSAEKPAPDDWTVQALRDLIAQSPMLPSEQREAYVHFVQKVVEVQISAQTIESDNPSDIGCYLPFGRVNGTAARLEGMLAAYELLPSNDRRARWALRHSIGAAANCLIRGQLPNGAFVTQLEDAKAARPDVNEVRIDNTQHALMALMNFKRLGFTLADPVYATTSEIRANGWRASSFSNIRFPNTRLVGVDATLAKFYHWDLTASLAEWPRLRGAVFIESQLHGLSIIGGDGAGLRAWMSDLRETRFLGTNLAAADFSFSDLRGAHFEGANLDGASFAGADTRGAIFDDETLLPFTREEAERRGWKFRPSKSL